MGSSTKSDELELGHISGVFGVVGEVRLFLHNPDAAWPKAGRDVTLIGAGGVRREVRLYARPGAGKRILGRIDGVSDRDEAHALMDSRIVVPRASLAPLGDGEYYLSELEGAEVRMDDVRVGTVTRIHASGPVEILEIDLGEPEPVFVPSLATFVASVSEGLVVLHPGALED